MHPEIEVIGANIHWRRIVQQYKHIPNSQHRLSLRRPPHRPPSLSYGYQQPRGQSYSGPSSLSLDRRPLAASDHLPGHPAASLPYRIDLNEGIDGKQRKRRGNLPKETTDELRAWFVAHLQHPYPTEDEKQELMRQTGLQMSKFPAQTTVVDYAANLYGQIKFQTGLSTLGDVNFLQ